MSKDNEKKSSKKVKQEGIPTLVSIVKPREITQEMRESYIDYAMSVIVARALPDVRDGLKPVQRRILYSMNEIGLNHSSKFRKSASVVGDVLAKYHPHGDVSVYDTMVRMAQEFSLRYPLVDGQGNFGSIDGDPPAAYRYTEARLEKIAEESLKEIDRDTVNFVENYDGTRKEPTVLPSLLPNLLLNGALGIAVGMATSIPPHNLGELCDAAIHLIENPEANTEDLFAFVKGPDFPTGGTIYNKKEIIAAYSQGKGPIVCRGKADITEDNKGRQMIVITEIPYQVNKSSLVENFARLVEEKRIVGVRDIRDESGKEGIRIVVYLGKEVPPQKILNQLYKHSDLQKTFHLNMLALVDGIQPKILSLSEALNYYLAHRREVVTRRTKYDLMKAKEREHILEGLAKCLADIDEVIAIIRRSDDREDAKQNLMKRFRLSEIQANAILETKLAALAKLERKKIDDELKEIRGKIKELTELLNSPKRIASVIQKEILGLRETYADERRTKVIVGKIDEISDEDLIPEQEVVVAVTSSGYVKRINPEMYRLQKRGGKGSLGMKTGDEDIIEQFISANTHDSLLFFTDSGKVFRIPAYEVPEGSKGSKGRALVNFLEINSEEKVLAVLPIKKEDVKDESKFLIMVTKDGTTKKTLLSEFHNIRRSGLIAINLKKGDLLCSVKKGGKDDEVILITRKGQSVKFKEKEIRPLSRQAAGVRGMKLKKDDLIIGMAVVASPKNAKEVGVSQNYLLIIAENGFGKMTNLKEYRLQKHGGSGIKAMKITPKTGDMVGCEVLSGDEEDLIVISQKGQVIKTAISSVPKSSRATQGVRLMKLEDGSKVAKMTCL